VEAISRVMQAFDLGFLFDPKTQLHIPAEYFASVLAGFLIVICFLLLLRVRAISATLSDLNFIQERFYKIELAISEFKNKTANQFSHADQQNKMLAQDVAQIQKIMEIIFSKEPATPRVASKYEESHRVAGDHSGPRTVVEKVKSDVRLFKNE
jgi:hypothetical protein